MYVGIDLAAKEKNETGVCLLNDDIDAKTVFRDEEIVKIARKGEVVTIDAPLTRSDEPFRPAERKMMSEFEPMLPLNTPGMLLLAERARQIRGRLEEDSEVIETYPRAVEQVIDDREDRKHFQNDHEFDAYLCALTAKRYSEGRYKRYGEEFEFIVLPL
ncbi:MAG: hypothetical protein ACOCSJ_04275 [Candidatus Natronoplasma sp.]